MNLEEYIKSQLTLHKQPDLKAIYQELINFGHSPKEIYEAINEQISTNINQAINDYLKNKNEE